MSALCTKGRGEEHSRTLAPFPFIFAVRTAAQPLLPFVLDAGTVERRLPHPIPSPNTVVPIPAPSLCSTQAPPNNRQCPWHDLRLGWPRGEQCPATAAAEKPAALLLIWRVYVYMYIHLIRFGFMFLFGLVWFWTPAVIDFDLKPT
ncbi:hypothetical protein BS78_07G014300 [Paspalum vaginatum]|nr:hypothetical protein BS78_07G014300 [Paspalum vaginatum]